MSEEAPSGYTHMLAGDIRKAVDTAIAKREAENKAWVEDTVPKLIAWRNRTNWFHRFDMWGTPKEPKALLAWFLDHGWWNRPSIPGVKDEPRVSEFHKDWRRRVRNLADDKQVFVAIDDAAALITWLNP